MKKNKEKVIITDKLLLKQGFSLLSESNNGKNKLYQIDDNLLLISKEENNYFFLWNSFISPKNQRLCAAQLTTIKQVTQLYNLLKRK